MTTNTPWEIVDVSPGTAKYLRGTHQIWSRIADGEHIFTVLPIGTRPSDGDGGYYSIVAALKTKGLEIF